MTSDLKLSNSLKFHASKKAPKQRKKRDAQSRYVYNLVVTTWLFLFENNLMHPKMSELDPSAYETIVHNMWWLCADEITSLNKFNLKNEVPLLMEQEIKNTIKKIWKKSVKKTVKAKKPLSSKKK